MFRPQRSSGPLLKLLRSAVANAKNNNKLSEAKLAVKNIRVDQGPVLKRFLPRAQGRATPILKRTSHVTLVLEEKTISSPVRFNIVSLKKIKTSKKGKAAKIKTEEKEVEKLKRPKSSDISNKVSGEKVGFFKRIFRRKSV